MTLTSCENTVTPPHPRVLGWFGTSALAMGGSNQMIFLITALFVGQGAILGQGSAAVPLLIFGVLLGWAAAPAWTELVLMWPNRVGGISAACAEASSVGGPSTCPSPDTSLMSSPVPPRGVVGVSPGSRCKGGIAPTGRGWPVGVESAEVPGVTGALEA